MASNVDARLLKSTKFPPEFNQKVDMQKVNLQVMKKWIASRICEILGSEDDVVIELCFNLIEGSRFPDIKSLQIQLTGFLDKDTAPFCKELWKLFLSAQSSPQGVPKELLEAKKLELIQEKVEADRVAEEDRRRRDEAERRHQGAGGRDRRDWGRGNRGGDTWRGGRGHRDGEPRGRLGPGRGGDRSRSPPRYREHRERSDYRGKPSGDSYVPGGRGRDRISGRQHRPSRSPSRSRERSPMPKRRRRSPTRSSSAQSQSPPTKRQRHPDSLSRSPSPGTSPRRGRRRARSVAYASSGNSASRSGSPQRRPRSRTGSTEPAGLERDGGGTNHQEHGRRRGHPQTSPRDRRRRRNTSSGSSTPRRRASPSQSTGHDSGKS